MKNFMKVPLFISLCFAILFGCSNPEKPKENTPAITLEEFNGVTKGMEIEEVIALIGGEGKSLGESGKKGTPAYQVTIVWDGEKVPAFGQISFRNDKVVTKMQQGLQ